MARTDRSNSSNPPDTSTNASAPKASPAAKAPKAKARPSQPAASSLAASASSVPSYSIGVAARLAGVPVETVRMWERRYDVLRPGRSSGGHRLYSDADVSLLRAARALVERGWRPNAIFALGADEIRREASAPAPEPPPQWADLIDAVIDAGRAFDEARAASLLDGPLVQRELFDVATSLWLPVLARVGALWEAGALSVAVEHFVQQLVSSRLQAALRATPGAAGPLALCACVPDERHEAGLFAAALALKRAGFVVVLLGGDLPADELLAAARARRPAVIVLSATATLSAKARATLPATFARPPLASLPVLAGGRSAPALAALLARPNVVVVDDVADVVSAAATATAA